MIAIIIYNTGNIKFMQLGYLSTKNLENMIKIITKQQLSYTAINYGFYLKY